MKSQKKGAENRSLSRTVRASLSPGARGLYCLGLYGLGAEEGARLLGVLCCLSHTLGLGGVEIGVHIVHSIVGRVGRDTRFEAVEHLVGKGLSLLLRVAARQRP